MPKEEWKNFTKLIDDHTECNKDSFFKKAEFMETLKTDCLGKHKCNFDGKIKALFD